MRLNKYISHNTKYSRREADKLIEEGEVTLNKKVLKDFSYEVEEDDHISVKGRPVKVSTELTIIVYNKPKGVLVTKKMTEAVRPFTISFQGNTDILYP